MTHEQTPNAGNSQGTPATAASKDAMQLIEKGWTVYDALERPVGNVTDVDMARDMLQIDGRPAGFDAFEVPFRIIGGTGGGEVHLTQAVDVESSSTDAIPHFITAPTSMPATPAASEAQGASAPPRRVTESAATATGTSPTPITATTTTFAGRTNAPYAAPATSTPMTNPRPPATDWIRYDEDQPAADEGWSAGRIASGALAISGLAVATYLMRRRNRRKTTTERLAEAAMQAFGSASGFARDRHPAWWASLAAAALPAAYYAWPSTQPTTGQRAGAHIDALSGGVGGYAGALTSHLPSTHAMMAMVDDLSDSAQSALRRTMPADWTASTRPDLALTGGLLAASALAFYLARRSMKRSPSGTRISDVMTRQPRVIQPDATVADAALMMRRLDIGALPVCDGSRLIGMLTDRDITLRSTADGRDPHLTPVRDIMTPGVAWASENDPVEEAARIMRDHRIRRLPIVDERHSLVGVVSLGDLAVNVGDDDLSGDTLETISEKK